MKFQSIQALRALAALMVVVFHSKSAIWPVEDRELLWWWPSFSDFGDLGVSLFFVISGFIIASVISKRSFSTRSFIWHRFWRIYPLYTLVMIAGLFMFWKRNWFQWEFESLGIAGMIKSFLILPQKPFPFWAPGWSLEHELLFYLIAALVAPLLGMRALAALMFALAIVGMKFVTFWDWHLFASYQLYFGAGIVAFLLKDRRWYESLPVALVLLGCAYAFYYKALAAPSQVIEFAFAFGCAALIVTLLDVERRGWNVPKPLVVIGDGSYSLYLWHWMVLPFASGGRETFGGSPELWRWIIVAVSIAVALVSHRYIEVLCDDFSHGRLKSQRKIAPAE